MPKKLPGPWTFLTLVIRLLAAEPEKPEVGLVDVLTGRYTIDRTGANLRESILTPANISGSRFGKLFERQTRGDIYAQPLIKTAVDIPGRGKRDIIYIATGANHIYAFDASSPAEEQPFWHIDPTLLGEPSSRQAVTDLPATQPYLNFENKIGIIATPVIDPRSNTIYVVAQSVLKSEFRFRLHAFDLATGREKTEMGSPAQIAASYNGNGIGSEDGKLRFESRKMLNRPGLLLVDGVLYLAFAAHLDGEPTRNAHGWVMAYAASNLKQLSALCTTPDGILGGIWQSGAGLAAQSRARTHPLIYAVTGNGSVGGRNYGQSILQLYPAAMLSVKLAFTPEEHAYQNDRDLDLSTGPVSLSSNGDAPGSAILWATLPVSGDANAATVQGLIRAFDAAHVEKELWNSERLPDRDRLGLFAKFCPPVVANGKLYAATFANPAGVSKLVVYGLLPAGNEPSR